MREWVCVQGFGADIQEKRRRALGICDTPQGPRVRVATDGSPLEELIPPEALEDVIRRDEHNAARRQAERMHAEQERRIQDRADAARRAAYRGFLDNKAPAQAARIQATLERVQGFGSLGVGSRREILSRAVYREGARVVHTAKGRRLTLPDGRYWEERDTTKIGMDFAEHLLEDEED